MFHDMRRLHSRGPANRGICVDANGAMLGPACVLVRQTARGFQSIERVEAAVLQKCALGPDHDEDWLFRQSQRIADALSDGEVALAKFTACASRYEKSTTSCCNASRRCRSAKPATIPTSRAFRKTNRMPVSGPAKAATVQKAAIPPRPRAMVVRARVAEIPAERRHPR
jgi:hypothetical protein